MARILITGSSDGLGLLAAKALIDQRHQVVLHARNAGRAQETRRRVPDCETVLIGDLASPEETRALAAAANALGRMDAVIHNAGVYQASSQEILAVNTLAPYILTCLIQPPHRLIYLSSGMHLHGDPSLKSITAGKATIRYSDSKLHMVLLAKAIARLRPGVFANAVDPGWVPTRMGGRGAPDDLGKGFETQVWLAVSGDEKARVSGRYFFHKQESRDHPATAHPALQDEFLAVCEQITGVSLPPEAP